MMGGEGKKGQTRGQTWLVSLLWRFGIIAMGGGIKVGWSGQSKDEVGVGR